MTLGGWEEKWCPNLAMGVRAVLMAMYSGKIGAPRMLSDDVFEQLHPYPHVCGNLVVDVLR